MTEFSFRKVGTTYVSKLPITQGVVQIHFKGDATVSVSANFPNMPPSVVRTMHNPYSNSILFELKMPEGVEVKLSTQSEVLKALYM